MKKGIIIAIVVIAGGAGIYLIFNQNKAQAPADKGITIGDTRVQINPNPAMADKTNDQQSTSMPNAQNKMIDNKTATSSKGTFSNGEEQPGSDIQVVEIVYDGSKFTPSTVNIKVNDWVFFKNTSDSNFSPASNPHPSHTAYPEFDAKPGVAAGGTYKFQFTKAGNWGFHDHLNARAFGKINVSQ